MEQKKTERINSILTHPSYIEYVSQNAEKEQDRVFCHHDMGHFLDVARLAEILNLTDGSYVGYEGTLSAGNRPEGKLTVHMGTADLSNGAAEAFHNRSAQAVTYEGDFTAEGKPATTTPASLTGEGKLAYASRQEGKSTNYLTVTAESADDAFAPEQLGICSIWN